MFKEKSETINLVKILKEKIEEKGQSWNLLEKCLYIYKETCKYFNYDERIKGDNYQIANKRIDITNVDDYRVVCTTWCYLFKDLADTLLKDEENYKTTSIINETGNHHYIEFITKDNKILKLDPTEKCKEFYYANKGFEFEIGPQKGTMYSDTNNSIQDNIKTLKTMLNNISDDYSCNYLDYLKLVKEELTTKYKTNNFSNLSYEQLNEIFTYTLTTTSFKGLGLIEAEKLIFKVLDEILDCSAKEKDFFSEMIFGFFDDECYCDIHIPKDAEDNEVYRLTRKSTNDIAYEKVLTYKREGNFSIK